MALMFVTEYAELARDIDGNIIQAGQEPALARQVITYSTTVASAAFQNRTKFVRIYCSAAAYLNFADAPTSTTLQGTPVAITTAEFFGVIPGQKVSAVA